MSTRRIPPKPGQESVWDYPRPPRLEPVEARIRLVHAGLVLVDTRQALRILETSHPPTYYLPPADIAMEHLQRVSRTSHCEWKGQAHYYDLRIGTHHVPMVAWSYATPRAAYADLANYLAFYPSKIDTCYVGDEQVQAQAGDFYGGWITSNIVGPFKGAPGTWGW
ncbi:MAG: DUF427 domain-containing protein [Bacteroidota bacterium]